MARTVTPDQLDAEIDRIEREIGDYHRDLVAELAGHAIGRCVDDSPVRTGAYKASHTVIRHVGSGPGPILYEGPDRVGDDEETPDLPGDPRYQPASGEEAERELKEKLRPYQSIEIRNGRFYADDPVERKYTIYEAARISTESEAERLAVRPKRIE